MKIMPYKLVRRLFCLAVAVLVGGCALMDVPPPLTQVLLEPTLPAASSGTVEISTDTSLSKVQLAVNEPSADGVASSERINAVFNGYELRYLAGVRWAAPVSKMLQGLFVDTLQGTHAFGGVGYGGNGMRADIRLNTDVRRFGLRYQEKGTPVVEAALRFRLIEAQTGRILGTLMIDEEEAVGEDSVPLFVAAFNVMMGRVLTTLKAWAIETSGLAGVSGR